MIKLRIASAEDAKKLLKIYSPYVMNSAVSFEYETPSVEEFKRRIENTLKEYPYIVAVEDDRILGYVYASAFHSRQAYKHCAETSIYIAEDAHKRGLGRLLYNEIEKYLVRQNVYCLYACIASVDGEDEHLSDASILFHDKMGYRLDGKHTGCGYKFGKWYDVVWMSKEIAKRDAFPKDFIPFKDIR